MCGIVGIISSKHHETNVIHMARRIMHRGPDDVGYYNAIGVNLGFRRLSIIDLSEKGHQPMTSRDGRYTIIFNGEIYNYKKIRNELLDKGFIFHSNSDSEVILNGFAEWGEDIVEKLNGMFSFAIWDEFKKTLFAARDRTGIKPFYYYYDQSKELFCFSSELRAFQEVSDITLKISLISLNQYLRFGSFGQPSTVYEGIICLLPGHTLLFNNNVITIKKYWSLEHVDTKIDSSIRMLDEILGKTIEDQMMSEVPYGAFLSGGIDSSLIVSYMSAITSGKAETISIGFSKDTKIFNEISIARRTADLFKTNHHEVILHSDDIIGELPSFINSLDQPSYDGLNSYFVSKYARKFVTVALSGLGGDELFLGYNHHKSIYNRRNIISTLQRIYPIIGLLYARIPKLLGMRFEKTHRSQIDTILDHSSKLIMGLWNQYFTIFNNSEISLLLNQTDPIITTESETRSLSTILATQDMNFYMRNTLLRDIDAVSMYHSLEVRVPFLDNRVIDFALNLPLEKKINKKWGTKAILRELAAKRGLHHEVFKGEKHGFVFPLDEWLRGPLREKVTETLIEKSNPMSSLFSVVALKKLLDSYYSGENVPYMKIWSLFVLFAWYEQTTNA